MRYPALALLFCAPAFAQFYTVSQPTSQYTSGTTVVTISAGNATTVTSPLVGGGQSVGLSTSLTAYNAGIGAGIFNPWGTAPDVEATSLKILATATNQTALTLTLDTPANTFGFELAAVNRCEPFPACALAIPPPVSTYSVTVNFFNGVTNLGSVTQGVTYNSAKLFAASSNTKIDRVTISVPIGAGGFGIGQLRYGQTLLTPVVSVPALGLPELGGLGLLLAAAGALLARRATLEA